MTHKPSFKNLGTQAVDQLEPEIELLNRVQMFQIAVNKINHNLEFRKKEPIFKLAQT